MGTAVLLCFLVYFAFRYFALDQREFGSSAAVTGLLMAMAIGLDRTRIWVTDRRLCP